MTIQITITGGNAAEVKDELQAFALGLDTKRQWTEATGKAEGASGSIDTEDDSEEEVAPAKPKRKTRAKAKPAPEPDDAEEDTPQVTKVDLQKQMKVVIEAGNKKGLKALMEDKFDADKFSDIDESDYPAFLEALKEME